MIGLRISKGALLACLGSIGSILCGLLVVGLFLLLAGRNPINIYAGIFTSAFGDNFAISETLVAATPVMFCALARNRSNHVASGWRYRDRLSTRHDKRSATAGTS